MRQRRRILIAVFLGFLLFPAWVSAEPLETTAQQFARRLQNGSQLYELSRWQEAAMEFRRAQELTQDINDWSKALYWVILSQLAYSDYGSALRDMEQLERNAPNSTYTRDMIYHRARVYYLQGYFEEALILFNRYNASTTDSDRVAAERRAAAFFWMGECLFSMAQFDEAEKFYAWVIARYPESPKVEASAYRIDLIKQKKIEAELLALLQLSHEQALRTSEDYQRTIRTYEHTINNFQRRIAELTTEQPIPHTQVIPEDIIIPNNNIINPEPEIEFIEDVIIEPENVSLINQNLENERLIQRAIQLGNNVNEIIREGTGGTR